MVISDLNPYIRFAEKFTDIPSTNKTPSICYDCRLFFLDNITGNIVISGKKYNIINKTVIYLPPETCYTFDITSGENFSMTVLNFDLTSHNTHIKNSIGTATPDNFQKELVPQYSLCKELTSPVVKYGSHIEHLMSQCTDNFILKTSYYRENTSAVLKMALLEIIKPESEIVHSELCKAVLLYIQENYSNPSLSNEDIASNFNYHPYHLSIIIKKETGKTLHQFLIYYRLINARNLLSATNYGISEIAWRSGFDSPAYFTKLFKQNIGETPKEYRKNHKNNI